MGSEVASELSREEKRALRKAEKRKAKFGPDANENGSGPIPKTYKGKGKATDLVLPGAETDIHTSKSEKKVKKRDRETEIGPSTAERASKKQRKSADATLEFATAESPDTTLPTEVVDPKKKDRKVKKEKKRSIEATENQEVAASLPASTKSRSKNSVSLTFPDPSSDESLPESSLKSLIYAYQYSRKEDLIGDDAWKFSKARQNWLVRHIWYDDAVPEQYVPLVIHYLKSVQGGSREAIIKGCNIILNPTTPVVAVPVPSTEGGESGPRKVKFAEEAPEDPSVGPPPTDPAEERRAEIRRSRAQTLLDALSGLDS